MLRGLAGQFSIVFAPGYRPFRNLLVAWLISTVGTWTAFFAVRIALYQQTNSPVWITVLLFCELAPGVVLGITVGPLIDRWPRQRMMILSDLGGVAAFAALPFVHSAAGICAVSAFAGFSAAFFRPGCYASIPNLVTDEDVVAANSLMQSVENLATLAGPLLAAAGVITIGAHSVYALNALSFLLSALLLAQIGSRLDSAVRSRIAAGHWREVVAGFSFVKRDRYLSSVFLIWSWATLAYTGINVAEIVLAKSKDQGYGTGSLGFGIFVAASALGAIAGAVGAQTFIRRLGVYGGYRASFLVTAAGVAICAVSPNLALGCVGALIYGLGNGVGLVCNITIIQQVVPDERRGQIFAVLGSLVRTFTLAGTLIAGPLIVQVGPRWTWGISAAILCVGYLNAVAFTARRARQGTLPPENREDTTPPDPATTANGARPDGTGLQRLGSLLDEVERMHEAEEARGFVTRSRKHYLRGSGRRRLRD